MTEEKTERANCHFVIKQSPDGKPQIIVERYHQTIAALNNTVLGFDLLGGTTREEARKAVALLNENVLNSSSPESNPEQRQSVTTILRPATELNWLQQRMHYLRSSRRVESCPRLRPG
jgi:hypothetical protein